MSTIFRLASRNVSRNRRRSILTALAVAVAVAALIFSHSYFKGILSSGYKTVIMTEAGHIRIVEREFERRERMLPLDFLVKSTAEIERAAQEITAVERVLPRLRFHVMLNHQEENEIAVGVGLYVDREADVLPVFKHIVDGHPPSPASQDMLVGSGLAEELGLHVGDSLLVVARTVYYSHDAMLFNVRGIFRTGLQTLDNHNFYIPIESARILLDADDMSSEILVFVDHAERSREITENLRPLITHAGEDLLAVPWQDHYLLRDLILWMKTALLVLYGLILFIASLVIVNTMLMAVLERTHEMGVMMAMGMKGRDLVKLFLAEAAFIALVGGLLGGALGSGLAIYTEAVGIDFSRILGEVEAPIPYLQDYTIYPDFTLGALGLGILFGLIMALVATILPCQKAARLVPTEAIRKT